MPLCAGCVFISCTRPAPGSPYLHIPTSREKYGDYFGIGVAGYPEAHPDVIVEDKDKMKENYWADIDYLKKKVADCFFAQCFFLPLFGGCACCMVVDTGCLYMTCT